MLLVALFRLFLLLKEAHDGVCRINLRGIIQVCIDISCGADVAVSEPFLDVFQRNSVRVKQAGTTVSQIVEANPPHSMLLKEVRESCCQILRFNQFPKLVYEDVVHVVLAVTAPAQSLIRSLLVLKGV